MAGKHNQAGLRLFVTVKPSWERPWPGHKPLSGGGLSADLGTIVAGPVPIRSLKDGEGRWHRVSALSDWFGSVRETTANAYTTVDDDGNTSTWVVGGPYGVRFGRCVTPIIWVEEPTDLPRHVAKKLGVSDESGN